jgi:hypothetical protein
VLLKIEHFENKPEMHGKVWNVVLEKDGEDQLDGFLKKEVLRRLKLERDFLHTIQRREAKGSVTSCVRISF